MAKALKSATKVVNSAEQKAEEKIIETYNKKGITFDDKTLYQEPQKDKIEIKPRFKSTIDMPILSDFYEILKKDSRTKKFELEILPFKFFSILLRFFNKTNPVKNIPIIIFS